MQEGVGSADTQVNASDSPAASESSTPMLSRGLVWLLAIACGLGVANLYYIQPLLVTMAHEFSVSDSVVGGIATLSQLGYALGLFLIVPLGDVFNRRSLIAINLACVTLALIAIALAPSVVWLGPGFLVLGATTVVPQVIVPFVAALAEPHERGRVVGMVMSGLLIGILLARTVSGFISAHLGWRAMYWIAAGIMALLLVVLRICLPQEKPRERISYPRLLLSLWDIVIQEPVVREAGLFGALTFASFQIFWVTLAFFLNSSLYHFSSDVVGLFGLVGVAGALTASFVGKKADHSNPRVITGLMMGLVLLTYIVFWLAGQWIWGLVIGVILLDMGTQGAHISNQTRIYALARGSLSRFNTVYMVCYFVGGTLGSALGTVAWSIAGWPGVCCLGVVCMVLALLVYLLRGLRRPVPYQEG